ncbi:hypothetical protein C8Q77DRAFT_385884 [Trametes polyzona]|nr:hypothetical protein C8Q77DRAFT_385884 [Trametes polyzona]
MTEVARCPGEADATRLSASRVRNATTRRFPTHTPPSFLTSSHCACSPTDDGHSFLLTPSLFHLLDSSRIFHPLLPKAPRMIRSALCHVPLTRTLVTPALRLAHTAALRHPSLVLLRSAPSPSPARDALHARAFSSSPQRRAEEDPELQHVFQQQQKLLKLLQEKPEVLEHIKKFVEQLESNGINVYSGKMPSKMDMFRLLMKPEIRESAMKMATVFQEAGIDMSKDMMQSLMSADLKKHLGDK